MLDLHPHVIRKDVDCWELAFSRLDVVLTGEQLTRTCHRPHLHTHPGTYPFTVLDRLDSVLNTTEYSWELAFVPLDRLAHPHRSR